jgi:hypothetical protein
MKNESLPFCEPLAFVMEDSNDVKEKEKMEADGGDGVLLLQASARPHYVRTLRLAIATWEKAASRVNDCKAIVGSGG